MGDTGNAIIGGSLASALATHSYGVSALGAPGSGSLGATAIAAHMPTPVIDSFSTGELSGGSGGYQNENEFKSHPNVINENSDAPIMAHRFLSAPAAHMLPGQDDLVFIHKPKREGHAVHPSLQGAAHPRMQAYATGIAAQEAHDLRTLTGLNIWSVNYIWAMEQLHLWKTNPERAAELTPSQIWDGVEDLFWTGWTCDGGCRLESLEGGQTGNIHNDGYATFTPFKITEKTPRSPLPVKGQSIVRAGKCRLRDLWGARAGRAGASLHLIATAQPFVGSDSVTYVTTAKSETMHATPTSVMQVVKLPTLAEFHAYANTTPKLTPRAKEMLLSMKQLPPIFQLFPLSIDNGDDVPLDFRVYEDAWEMPHYDGRPLRVGKILHPAYAAATEPGLERPTDPGFAPAINGFDAMTRKLITNVVLDACKDGHMALA
jgi:hypothetical protein